MNKIKKQFKDFWNFYRLLNYGYNVRESNRSMGVCYLIAALCAVASMLHFGSASFSILVVFLVIVWSVGRATFDKTSFISLSPFTPAQRVAFTYLTILFSAVLFAVLIAAVTLVLISVIALIVFCIDGSNFFVTEKIFAKFGALTFTTGGGILALTYAILALSTLALVHIDNKKIRNIVSVSFGVSYEVMLLIIANVCGFAAQRGQGVIKPFFFMVNLYEAADKLNYPWITFTVLGALSAAAFGVALWLVIKRFGSTKL